MSLLVPKHYQQASQAAEAIKASSIHRMDSDDFVTPTEVGRQLNQLQEYVDERRKEEPAYILPLPSGWKIAVLMLTIPETSGGGVIVVDDAREMRSVSSPQGVILSMGPAAYSDPTRFAVHGEMQPWHRVGDRILWVKYDATMFQLANGQRIGFMNDTQPMATVDTGWGVPV